jgi:hypothetical protein
MRIYTGMIVTVMTSIPLTYCGSSCVSMSAEHQRRNVYYSCVYKRFRVRGAVLRKYILKPFCHGFSHPAHTNICTRYYNLLINPSTMPWLRVSEVDHSPRGHVSIPGQSVWKLWWTYWL